MFATKKVLMLPLLFAIVVFSGLTSCSDGSSNNSADKTQAKEGIVVSDAWIRKMPDGITNTAAFMTINNYTDNDVMLIGISLKQAKNIMMHESKVVDGMAKMEHLNDVTINKHGQVTFEPGGKHVMIMGLDMSNDPKFYNINLHFANNPTLEVKAEVRRVNK